MSYYKRKKRHSKKKNSTIGFLIAAAVFFVYVLVILQPQNLPEIKIFNESAEEIGILSLTKQATNICESKCIELKNAVPNWDGISSIKEYEYCSLKFDLSSEGKTNSETCWPKTQILPNLPVYEESISGCVVNSHVVTSDACI